MRRLSCIPLVATLAVGAWQGRAAWAGPACPTTRLTYDDIPAGVRWHGGTSYGPWFFVHDGSGTTHVGETPQGRRLWIAPRAAADASETFSSLVRSVRSFRNTDFTVTFRTLAQLRRPRPNAWEVAWAIWNYRDNDHFYYFIVKPNGWELGKEDPAYRGKQRFLASSSETRFPIRRWYRLRVRQIGDQISVWIDGRPAIRFRDRDRPYRSGAVALYVEDASAVFGPVTVRSC